MGRKPLNKKTSVINGKEYNFKPKQIVLKGVTLDMFNFDREQRGLTESQVGSQIIGEHYRRTPPIGFFTRPKD